MPYINRHENPYFEEVEHLEGVKGCLFHSSQELWEKVMGANPSMEEINWLDAVRFCNALSSLDYLQPVYGIGTGDKPTVSLDPTSNGYRLPTEAEWLAATGDGECGWMGEEVWGIRRSEVSSILHTPIFRGSRRGFTLIIARN